MIQIRKETNNAQKESNNFNCYYHMYHSSNCHKFAYE